MNKVVLILTFHYSAIKLTVDSALVVKNTH